MLTSIGLMFYHEFLLFISSQVGTVIVGPQIRKF